MAKHKSKNAHGILQENRINRKKQLFSVRLAEKCSKVRLKKKNRKKLVEISPSVVTEANRDSAKVLKVQMEELHKNAVPEVSYVKQSETILSCETSLELCEFYQVNDKSFVIKIPLGMTLYFNGVLKVQALRGSLEIYGYHLKANRGEVSVYSLTGMCAIGITALEPDKIASKMPEFCEKLGVTFEPDDIVILVSLKESTSWKSFMKEHEKFPLFLDGHNSNERIRNAEKCLECKFIANENECLLLNLINPWREISITLREMWLSMKLKGSVMVCGGKGVGKSTLLHFLINKCLNDRDEALVLDLDIGQSEFSIPGCISAVVIRRPLLGPNFSHILPTKKSYFVGVINVMDRIGDYIKSVERLVKYCDSDDKLRSLPRFINTMGFTKGLGLDLISYIAHCVKPSDVIQISSANTDFNFFTSLEPAYLLTVFKNSDLQTLFAKKYDDVTYNLHSTKAALDKVPFSRMDAQTKRRFTMLSYFYSAFKNSVETRTLNGIIPYKIPFDKVKITVIGMNENVDIISKVKTINGLLVALCQNDYKRDENHCVGFGIVRGFDKNKCFIYVSTPLERSALHQVTDVVMSSAIQLPDSIYTNQCKYIDCRIPFVAEGASHTLNEPIKRTSRGLLPREQQPG